MKTILLRSKNSVIRKSTAILLNYYRNFDPSRGTGPAVLANSFPKSGTHLLTQILESLPGVNSYGSFLASLPSITYKDKGKEKMLRKIGKVVPGELVTSHIHYDLLYQEKIKNKNIIHYFIYRDLRDVVISEAYYLTYMNRWHRLHKYFKALGSDSERIMFAITGDKDGALPFIYPDIGKRFEMYRGWLKEIEVFKVRFEDLISPTRREFIIDIVKHYIDQSDLEFGLEKILSNIENNINPEKSHTFRQGQSGSWGKIFSEKHKSIFKEIAGDKVVELGYEIDQNW